MTNLRIPRETSLYRCDVCGKVYRHYPGKTSLGHFHYDDHGAREGAGRLLEFYDDGRKDVEDLRESVWIA